MADADASQQHEMALAARLRLLWEQAHGSPAGEAHVLIGPNSVAASLDDVLSLAKRAVIKRADGQRSAMPNSYWRSSSPNCKRMSKPRWGATWLPAAFIRADVDTGHVVCFFLLGGPLAPPPVAGAESLI